MATKIWQPPASEDEPNPLTRCYIPSKVVDNPHIDQEAYKRQLQALDPVLRKALLDGNWDILEGVRFTAFNRDVHVITPETLRAPLFGYPRAVGVDYGSSAPFAALWGVKLRDNLILVYRELYQNGLTPQQQVELIKSSEDVDERRPERPIRVALDPACWQRPPSNPLGEVMHPDAPPTGSIAWFYRQGLGSSVVKARNDRVAGWALVDHHLHVRDDGLPRILIHDTCINLIRTLPTMQRAKTNPEDIVTTGVEDHLPDALRYLLFELSGMPVFFWGGGSTTDRVSVVSGDVHELF